MKLLKPLALAFGIALPLWYRQWRFEREVAARVEAFERAVADGLNERDRQVQRWTEELLEEIKRAFKTRAAR